MSMKQTLKALIREKSAEGWEIQLTRRSHFRWRHVPTGAIVFSSQSPSDHRSIQNIKSDLRRVERADLSAAPRACAA